MSHMARCVFYPACYVALVTLSLKSSSTCCCCCCCCCCCFGTWSSAGLYECSPAFYCGSAPFINTLSSSPGSCITKHRLSSYKSESFSPFISQLELCNLCSGAVCDNEWRSMLTLLVFVPGPPFVRASKVASSPFMLCLSLGLPLWPPLCLPSLSPPSAARPLPRQNAGIVRRGKPRWFSGTHWRGI